MGELEVLKPKQIKDIVFRMDEYINWMRTNRTEALQVVELLEAYITTYFQSNSHDELELKKSTVEIVDEMYVRLANLTIRDIHTDAYFEIIIKRLFFELQRKGIRVFFILDNQLRDDRFKGIIELFATGLFTTIHPYEINPEYYGEFNTPVPCKPYKSVEFQILQGKERKENILYLEKDDTVNYISNVLSLVEQFQDQYICVFRNLAPDGHSPATWLMVEKKDLNLISNQAVPFCNLAIESLKQFNYSDAIEKCDEAILLDPDYVKPYKIRAYSKFEGLSDFEGAIDDCGIILRLEPESAEFHLLRGFANFSLQNLEEARLDIEKANKLNPSFKQITSGMEMKYIIIHALE